MTIVNPISTLINPAQYNNGAFRKAGIEILPVQVGTNVRAAITNMGGNIVMFDIGNGDDRFSVTPCFLDLDQTDIPTFLQEAPNRTMGNIGGLTPVMSPVGRTTYLHRPGNTGNILSEMIALQGQRSLSPEVAIHGVLHNRPWKMEDLGTTHEGTAKVKVTFTVSETENSDLYNIFGTSGIIRTYGFKDSKLTLLAGSNTFKSETNIGLVDISTEITGWHDSFGDHSYFSIPGDDWTLVAPSSAKWNVDTEKKGILTGKTTTGNFYTSPTLITFDDTTYTELGTTSDIGLYNQARLRSELLKREIEITSYDHRKLLLSHRTIFTPQDGNGKLKGIVCVEPSITSPDVWKMRDAEREITQNPISTRPITLHQRIVVRTDKSHVNFL